MAERYLELGERAVAAAWDRVLVVGSRSVRKGSKVKDSSLMSRDHSLVCPLCEGGELQPIGSGSVRCGSCGERFGGAILETLHQITALPDAQGAHACEECGHPEMRLLPDGVFHCPSCGSEVMIEAHHLTTRRTTAVAREALPRGMSEGGALEEEGFEGERAC